MERVTQSQSGHNSQDQSAADDPGEAARFSRGQMLDRSDVQPFSSHGTHKLITKIQQHTPKYVIFWANLTKKKIGMILVHSQWTAMVVLAVVVFYMTI